MKREQATYVYHSFEDDFVRSGDQGHALPADFAWVRTDLPGRIAARALYPVALACGRIYLWARLRWHVKGRTALGERKGGGFMLYCNHTQPVGDPFAPALAVRPVRTYVIASPSNLGIPFLGRLLPTLGALPIPDTIAGMRAFREAIAQRLAEGAAVVVYPEAHVWPYATMIRPFPAASFAFAVDNHVPAFCMTTTYHRRRHGSKPRAIAYLDGPFWPRAGVSRRQAREELRDQVHAAMEARARQSTYEYVRYVPCDRREGGAS